MCGWVSSWRRTGTLLLTNTGCSCHLINLLSIFLRSDGFVGTQKAVVIQTGSRPPVTMTFFFFFFLVLIWLWEGFPCGSVSICLQFRKPGLDPWVGKIPWRRKSLPTPVFWPGEFQGLHSRWGCKQPDTTKWPSLQWLWEVCWSFFTQPLGWLSPTVKSTFLTHH